MILNLISRLLSSKDDEDYRSAGACPPRTLGRSNDGEGQVFPPPYGERDAVFFTVARGPVPRDLSARDNPGEGQALALR